MLVLQTKRQYKYLRTTATKTERNTFHSLLSQQSLVCKFSFFNVVKDFQINQSLSRLFGQFLLFGVLEHMFWWSFSFSTSFRHPIKLEFMLIWNKFNMADRKFLTTIAVYESNHSKLVTGCFRGCWLRNIRRNDKNCYLWNIKYFSKCWLSLLSTF